MKGWFLLLPMFSLLMSPQLLADTLEQSDVMTEQEAEAMGLQHPTQQQRKAFSNWLEEWTQKVLQQAPTYHRSESIPGWVRSWPLFMRPNVDKNNPEVRKALKAANQKIYRNMNGEKIELMDGSVWKIIAFDQFTTKLWQRGDLIDVEKSARDLMRPYILHNKITDERVGASIERQASPTGEVQKDPKSYFTASHPVTSIDAEGEYVILKDGSKWKIAPVDQIKVKTNWQLSDRIRVTKSRDVVYKHELANLDSGDSVLANAAK